MTWIPRTTLKTQFQLLIVSPEQIRAKKPPTNQKIPLFYHILQEGWKEIKFVKVATCAS